MRTTGWLAASLLAMLLAACTRDASQGTAAPAAPPPPAAPSPDTRTIVHAEGPALTVAVLVDAASDSPFRWDPVTLRTRVEAGELWASATDVVAVLRPGATLAFVEDHLDLDGRRLAVPVQVVDTEAWAPVAPLARALDGYARRHPDDGSVVLWPASTLRWLAAHGDPQAPVLREARAAGWRQAPESSADAAAGAARLRVRNDGPADAMALRVLFPHTQIAFGDVRAGATSAYQAAPGGVYRYGAFRLRVDGREVTVPVEDWVGESPLPGTAFTYAVAVDSGTVRLVSIERER